MRTLKTVSLCSAVIALAWAWSRTGHAVDPTPRLLPNGTGDGYADYAPDAFGNLVSTECGGGFNADGSLKPLGAAEFDPLDAMLPAARGRGGIMCYGGLFLFSPDAQTRMVLADSGQNWGGGQQTYPDGTPLAPAPHPADLLEDGWTGPQRTVRKTRFRLHAFPGLEVTLEQRAACATLTQVYRFTNVSQAPLTFRVTQVADTDLGFGSNFLNNWGYKDPTDPSLSWVTNNARDVSVRMSHRIDPDQIFEGWRIKVQNSAGWERLRAPMYYGFPVPGAHDTPRCRRDPAAAACPAANHLNDIFLAVSGSHANSYFITPDGGSAAEVAGDRTGPAGGPDGWSDAKWDVAQSLQSLFTLPPGETREYATRYEAYPAACKLHTNAGPDAPVAVALATACEATVTLDGSTSVVASATPGDTFTYTWFDDAGREVATGPVATLTVAGAREHRFDLRVCNTGGQCDVDTTTIVAHDDTGACRDTDGDGLTDREDLDDDDDGLSDAAEGTADSDGDGATDALDRDSDDDGVPDLVEADDGDGDGATLREVVADADRDGAIDGRTKVDVGRDGWDDRYQSAPPGLVDHDGDGLPDVRDTDDDGDRVPTRLECPDGRTCPGRTSDGRALPDYLNIDDFACGALLSVGSGPWLGAGGFASGRWLPADATLAAVARDGQTGALLAVDDTGWLLRVTPGDAEVLADTGLGAGVTGLAADPWGEVVVAAQPLGSTTALYDIALATGAVKLRATVDGRVHDLAFDEAGGLVLSRTLGTIHQLVFPDRTVGTTAIWQGLVIEPGGAVLGLTATNAAMLSLSRVDRVTGAATHLFSPTRAWHPAHTPAALLDLARCPPNRAPAASPDWVVTAHETPVTVRPLDNDRDRDLVGTASGLVFTPGAVTPPVAGAGLFADTRDPTRLLVTPPAGWVGAIRFPYAIKDTHGLGDTAEVVVFVAPDARDDHHARVSGAPPEARSVLGNDVLGGRTDAFVVLGAEAPAWASIDGGRLVLAPPHDLSGNFEVPYQACVPTGLEDPSAPSEACDAATLHVRINATPTLSDASDATTTGGEEVVLDVADLFADPDGIAPDLSTLEALPVADTDCGLTVSREPASSVLVASPSAEPEVCTLRLTVCDLGVPAACATALWTVTVNDPPRAGQVALTVIPGASREVALSEFLAATSFGRIDGGLDATRLGLATTPLAATGPVAIGTGGGLCALDPEAGVVRYLAPDATGPDSCVLEVCEAVPADGSACGHVTLAVDVADALAVLPEVRVVAAGDALTLDAAALLANDSGADATTFALLETTAGPLATLTPERVTIATGETDGGTYYVRYRVCGRIDASDCAEVNAAVIVRRAPSLENATIWRGLGTHEATLNLAPGFRSDYPVRPDSLSVTRSEGSGAALPSGATLTLRPTDPDAPAAYLTEVRVCDAPDLTLPCPAAPATQTRRVTFCGPVPMASACASATVRWFWNDGPALRAFASTVLGGATLTRLLRTSDDEGLIRDTAVIHGDDPSDGDTDGLDLVSVGVSHTYDPLAGVAPADFGEATHLDRGVGDGACSVVRGLDSGEATAVVMLVPERAGQWTCWVQVCEERPADAPACTVTPLRATVPEGETEARDDRWFIATGSNLEVSAAYGLGENDTILDAGAPDFSAGPLVPGSAGTLVVAPEGALRFEPTPGFIGEATFPYTLKDGLGQRSDASATIVVNDPPNLTPATLALDSGETATLGLASVVLNTGGWHGDEAEDGDDDALAQALVRVGAGDDRGASTRLGSDGECAALVNGDLRVLAPTEPGIWTCEVQICEELPAEPPRACSTTSSSVTVARPAIEAVDDVFFLARGGRLSERAPGVLANDTGVGLSSLAVDETPPGAFALLATGALEWTPPADFAGVQRFAYRATDRFGSTDEATVAVTVNDPPTPRDVALTLAPGDEATVPTASLVADLGTVSGDDPLDGDIDGLAPGRTRLEGGRAVRVLGGDGVCSVLAGGDVIVQAPTSAGTYPCAVSVCEERPIAATGVCALAQVVVTVPEGQTEARDDRYATLVGVPLAVNEADSGVLGNDAVLGGTSGVASLVSGPPEAEGTVGLSDDGTFTFTPATDFVGETGFRYRLTDSLGQQSEAVARVLVNDPPTALEATLDVVSGDTLRWEAGDLVTDLGKVDGGGVDAEALDVTAGPCTVSEGGVTWVVAEDLPEALEACRVRVCEMEPADEPRACDEAVLSVRLPSAPPEPPKDPNDPSGFVAYGGGACQTGSGSGLLVWIAGALAFMGRRPRRPRG